eukprot:3542170-Pleurochrysis_carterae.AAC.4
MGNNGGSLHAERSLSCVSSNREDRDRAVDGDSERRAAETAAPEQRWYFPADEAALDKLQQGVRCVVCALVCTAAESGRRGSG